MEFELFDFLASAGGGAFGAAIGGLQAFIFTGFLVIAGVMGVLGGDSTVLDFWAFGPIFGPHVAFAGGVAAVAYAARKGYGDIKGNDIVTPLISLVKPDVLIVGGVFGMLGYVVNNIVALIPWFGSNTDTIAVTVIVSGIAARLFFGRTGLFGKVPQGSGWARFAPNEDAAWIRYHETPGQASAIGFFGGLAGAGGAIALASAFPDAGGVQTMIFGVSAVSLLFLSLGMSVPVTHHMTLPAGVAAIAFLPIFGPVGALIVGAVFGLLGALVGEFFSRLLHIHGDTHIDPPAAAIWPMTTLALGLAAMFA